MLLTRIHPAAMGRRSLARCLSGALAGALTLALPGAVLAEGAGSGAPPLPRMDLQTAFNVMAQVGEDTVRWAGRELGQERVIKGAPYCAEALHESIQPLADGNRIVQRQTTRLCRDGEGRTRQEITGKDGRRTVYLRDPVAGESWVLDPERKTARRSSSGHMARLNIDEGAFSGDAASWREHAERLREWARQMAERARDAARSGSGIAPPAPTPPVPPAPPAPPAPPTGSTTPSAQVNIAPVVISRTGGGGDGTSREVEVQLLRLSREAAAAAPPLPGMGSFSINVPPPAVGFNAGRFAPRGPGAVTPLPAREIEGVKANGERTTWTIEAGKLGNEKPIVITREVWTSPELMLTLLSRDNDPRSGEVSYRLQNLKRGEPDAALMKVPDDHAVSPRTAPKPPAAAGRG